MLNQQETFITSNIAPSVNGDLFAVHGARLEIKEECMSRNNKNGRAYFCITSGFFLVFRCLFLLKMHYLSTQKVSRTLNVLCNVDVERTWWLSGYFIQLNASS